MKMGLSIRSCGSGALLVVLAAAPAWADGDEEPARMKFDAAQNAFDLGEFERARALYAEAYELRALPALLFNIGQCHKKLGEWSKAAFFYRRYLAKVAEGTDTARLQELISEMEERERAEKPAKPVVVADAPRAGLVAGAPSPMQAAKLIAAVPEVPAVGAAPAPLVVMERDSEPVHRQWWFWAGAAAVTVATVTSILALGIASSRSDVAPPRYGKLDAR